MNTKKIRFTVVGFDEEETSTLKADCTLIVSEKLHEKLFKNGERCIDMHDTEVLEHIMSSTPDTDGFVELVNSMSEPDTFVTFFDSETTKYTDSVFTLPDSIEELLIEGLD
jgi:glutamine phosphoribosylpyrophosphate amidotransferase